MSNAEVTQIDDVWVCNNCGSYAKSVDKIVHHRKCSPGESKRWEKFYEENEEE